MSTSLKTFRQIDWEEVWKNLYLYAAWLVGGTSVTFDCGLQAEDLVAETLKAFFEDATHLRWNPEKAKIETFLRSVLKHKYIDHVRRNKHIDGSLSDPDYAQRLASRLTEMRDPTKGLAQDQFVDLIMAKVNDDEELKNLIVAVELIDGKHNVNQELGEILGVSASQVVNLKKRLLRKLKDTHEQKEQK